MTQGTVLKTLERNPKSWFTYKELSLRLKTNNISANATKLYHYGEIDRIEIFIDGYIIFLIRHKQEGRDENQLRE